MLFGYAFLSNVALAAVPHEPIVIWYGQQLGVWRTALVATGGTVAASWVDHRVLEPVIGRAASRPELWSGPLGKVRSLFGRAPFAIITLSGVTPLPFFPFKALAFAARYPVGRYLAAVAAGRLPRYLLLAWIGVVIHVPAWLLAGLFALLVLPSLRMLLWKRPSAK
ncbi:MAG: hypothetical protein GTO31_04560 [Xanthomonadales bacterium]|nr:hypothetical protein [Xanthomonadales bacterium]